MAYQNYKPETAFTNIHAAEANGWELWNLDADGVQWFKRADPFPVIHGAASDGDDDDTDTVDVSASEHAIERYHKIVELRASGEDIDHDYGDAVLEAADKTMDEFNEDVAELRLLDMELGCEE